MFINLWLLMYANVNVEFTYIHVQDVSTSQLVFILPHNDYIHIHIHIEDLTSRKCLISASVLDIVLPDTVHYSLPRECPITPPSPGCIKLCVCVCVSVLPQ